MPRTKERSGNSVVRFVRGVLFGDNLRDATVAGGVGVVVSLCIVVVQFAFIQPSFQPADLRWSLTGIVSILFSLSLFVIAAAYTSVGGGLTDCCCILIPAVFIANLTFQSVALTTGDPVPVWEWSFGNRFLLYLRWGISGALLWGSGLGVSGFAFGAVFRRAKPMRAS